MEIKIYNITKKQKLNKNSDGVRIFENMKSFVNNDLTMREFVLDATNMNEITPIVFKSIVIEMQTKLFGNYSVKLINAKPLVIKSYNTIFNR
ncbi:MAG: hypothetical protein KAG91_02820 [Mycoplasmataceae bacterium]|nr:hypothetical protein [Mycoplasmataceae bacterium]